MKSIAISLVGLLILAGCGATQPKPAVVVVDINKTVVTDANKTVPPKKKSKRVSVNQPKKPKKNVKVPPLPTPEVEIDMDSIIDQATDEVIS